MFENIEWLFNGGGWDLLSFLKGTDLRGNWFRYKVSLCDEFAVKGTSQKQLRIP